MAMTLRESDAPRGFSSKVAEYVQKPAWPTPKFLKDQIRVTTPPDGGMRIDFAVRSGSPLPYLYAVRARAERGDLFEEVIDYDHIGPFSTDDWVLEITRWHPAQLKLAVGIEPFEIRTDRVVLVL